MPVPLGFLAEALVLTPAGDRSLGSLAAGDEVLAVDVTDRSMAPAKVVAIRRERARRLVAIDLDDHVVQAAAPGTAFFDAFEDLFRAAGSLSSLSELWLYQDGALVERTVLEVPERDAPDREVLHLVLEAPAHAFVVDRVVVRHRDA